MDAELKNSDYRVSFSIKKDRKGSSSRYSTIHNPARGDGAHQYADGKGTHYEDCTEAYEEIYDDTKGPDGYSTYRSAVKNPASASRTTG